MNLPRLAIVLRICMDFVIFEHFVSELNLITALIKILLCRHYLSQGNLIEVKKILSEILKKEPNNPQAILLNQRVEHVRA